MELIQYQVDAFTDRLFGGNPAAVIPLEEWLPDDIMQAIALENNLSETAYFHPDGATYALRWFTPTTEVDLCGHATLASAHVLFRHLQFPSDQLSFQTRSGLLRVERQEGWYRMSFPADHLEAVSTPDAIVNAFDILPAETFRGREDYLVILHTQEEIEALQPTLHHLKGLDGRGVILSAPGRETDMASRCFFPNFGVDEDPVTGSAHTTLAPYWAKRLGKPELTAVQCSSRSGFLRLHLLRDRVEISGQAVTFSEGTIRI